MFFSEKQSEFFKKATHRINIKSGATRSGKSYMDLYLIPMRIREVSDKEGLIAILGNTQGSIRTNIIAPLKAIYGNELVGSISSNNTVMLFGKKCFVYGASKRNSVDVLRGSAFSYAYVDELSSIHEECFQMLLSRLCFPYSKMDATLNPESPSHWLYPYLYERDDLDIYLQEYCIDDNPFLDLDFKNNLKKEYSGTVFYDRYILGKWQKAEDLIFPNFNENCIFKNSDIENTKFIKYVVGVDAGVYNPCAFSLIGVDTNRKCYVLKEYFFNGRESREQKTDLEYTQDLKKFISDYPIEAVIVDSAAASLITQLKKERLPVKKSQKGVLDNIRRACRFINEGRLLINIACNETIFEFKNYVWDAKAKEEKPVKENDHLIDEILYCLAYLDNPHKVMNF